MKFQPIVIVLPLLLALVPLASVAQDAATAAPTDYASAKALADRDEAALPPQQAQALRKAQSTLLEFGASTCATPRPDTSPFTVVLQLDAQGQVTRSWLKGDTPLAICFRKFAATQRLPAPPRAPFYTSLELSFTR